MNSAHTRKNRNLALNLLAFALGMLMLAYASVPLYDLFCRITGYGGTTQLATAPQAGAVLERSVTVDFNADISPKLSWEFKPGERHKPTRIGEQTLTFYEAYNPENRPITGRAVYNVVPHKAGRYFTKIDCFCFTEQTLAAGQRVHMPISYYIDPAMADDPEMKGVETITLSYTFFEVEK